MTTISFTFGILCISSPIGLRACLMMGVNCSLVMNQVAKKTTSIKKPVMKKGIR